MTKKTDTLLGVSEQFTAVNDVDVAVEEIERNGYTILDNVLSDAELIYLYDGVLERIYRIQCEEIGGEDVMLKIGEDGSVKHLFSYDDFFVQMLTKEPPFSIIKSFLGENISLYLQNAIMNFSGVENPASVWHRDLPYQHYVSDSPLALTSLYVVDEFNSDTGGPFVLSGSHKFGKFPSSQFVERHAQQICAPVGSVLLFDSMLYHQAGYNRSNKVRRAILYRVENTQRLSKSCVSLIRRGDVDGVLFFSPRSAINFVKLLQQENLVELCCKIEAYGLSKAVIEAAAGVRWKGQNIAATPRQDELLALLKGDEN